MNQEPTPDVAHNETNYEDREQLIVDLDESVGMRQQAIADHEQDSLDREQAALDAQLPLLSRGSFTARVDAEYRQAEIDRGQERRDARQKQLDDEQTGRDELQDFLDQQRTDVETGVRPSVVAVEEAARRRQESALARADAAVRRAETARRRAEAARLRALAAHRRFESQPTSEAGPSENQHPAQT